jgi:hypothetical protein
MRLVTGAGSEGELASRQRMVATTLILAKKQAAMGSARIGALRW